MMSSKRTAVAALAAATVLAAAPLAHALDAGDQILLPWDACTPAGVILDGRSQYLLDGCGGNTLCLDGKYGDVSRCIPNSLSAITQCRVGWQDADYNPVQEGAAKPCPTGMTCSTTAWGHIAGYGDTLKHDDQSICVPNNLNVTVAAERAQLANAADRSAVFDTATVDTYGQCSLNKQCKSKQDLCHGFSSQLTMTNSQVSYNGKSGSDSVGFCAPATLPECSVSGSCPTGYECGSAGAAAGSNVCFPVGDAKVPASYFAATAAPTAAATQAPATTHAASATAAPTTAHATVAATTATHSAAPTIAAASTAVASTHAPTTTAADTVCGAGLLACGSACFDPAQSSYVCQNGQLAQATQQPINTGIAGEIIDATSAATAAASTQTPTQATTAATDATQQPATTAATTAATIPTSTGATESPVTASSSSTISGTSSQKTTTSAASSMLRHTVAPLLLAALTVAVAL